MKTLSMALLSVALVCSATSVEAQELAWPTVCVPAYVGPTGEMIPEQCATFGPGANGITGTLASGTIYDPTTGYVLPDAVRSAIALQGDVTAVWARGWSNHRYGVSPRHNFDAVNALDCGQFNELLWAAATGPRDTTTHTWLTLRNVNQIAPIQDAICGAEPRCRAGVKYFLQPVENFSVSAWGARHLDGVNGGVDLPSRAISPATLTAMLAVISREPQAGYALCEVAQ